MDILVINAAQVRALLPMAACMEVMESVLKALSSGSALNPLRSFTWLPDKSGLLATMPSYLDDIRMLGVKVITVMPGNHGSAYDSHQGAVLLFEAQHGSLLALLDASEITGIRTAAVSGVATRLLARPDAGDLAILGTGVQASTHLAAMLVARPLRRVRVYSRSAAHVEAFIAREGARHGLTIEAAPSAQAAVAGADIICTTTSSREPVLFGEWLSPGAHLNVVGASIATAREVDSAAMVRSRLFVDRRESTLNEAGDFLIPRGEGLIGDDHIQAELGEILLGQHAGRGSGDEITLFKSLGLAVEDLGAGEYIYRRALAEGVGTRVPFGETRHA